MFLSKTQLDRVYELFFHKKGKPLKSARHTYFQNFLNVREERNWYIAQKL